MGLIILYIINYLIGAIPFSFIIGKLYGKDIRQEGSGNVGATNVLRVCGKAAGILAYVCDISKGIATSLWTYNYLIKYELVNFESTQLTMYNFLLFSAFFIPVFGHMFSIYLKFRGGKGVATSAGVLLILLPVPLIGALMLFLLILSLTRIVSIASMVAAISLSWFVYFQYEFKEKIGILGYQTLLQEEYKLLLVTLTSVLGLLVIWRHKTNILRLIKGEESSFREK